MSDQRIIFSLQGVGKIIQPNNKYILKDIYLSFFYGAKIGIIGNNGSGKSTLLKIIAGKDSDFIGKIQFEKQYSIGLLEQEPELDATKTVREVVEEGMLHITQFLQEFEAISHRFSEPMSDEALEKLTQQMGAIQEKIDALDGWDIESRLQRAMDALNCPEPQAPISQLSGGERRRVALCRLLLQQPDILLLDEPTNHLDAESVMWLEQHLKQYKGTVIAVTHDRYFLDNIAEWILELDRGEGIPWKGNYSSWLDQKQQRLAAEEKATSRRQKALARELEWIRMSPKARQAKGKARLANYERMLAEESKRSADQLEIFIPPGPRLGNKVINAWQVSKTFGDTILFENLNFQLPPNGIVGVIGPNGAGKTTLFRMLVGDIAPDSGYFEFGDTVKIAYIDQMHQQLDPDKTVWETISDGHEYIELGKEKVNSRAYAAWFNFSGADQQKKISVLSGGERNRLHLALTLKQEANVLLLDEPTNDIDVHTLRALEEALEAYPGCAVLISHDRWFLDRVATHILSFEGNGQVYWFEGGFSDYEENRRKRMGITHPQRFRYKKLVKQ